MVKVSYSNMDDTVLYFNIIIENNYLGANIWDTWGSFSGSNATQRFKVRIG